MTLTRCSLTLLVLCTVLAAACAPSPTAPTPTDALIHAGTLPLLSFTPAPGCTPDALPWLPPTPPVHVHKARAGAEAIAYWPIVDASRNRTRYLAVTFARVAAASYGLCAWRTVEALP